MNLNGEKINVLLLAGHEPKKDPRLSWIATSDYPEIRIIQAGVSPFHDFILVQETTESMNTQYARSNKWNQGCFDVFFDKSLDNVVGRAGSKELVFLEYILTLSDRSLCRLLNILYNREILVRFRWYIRYILDVSFVLVSGAVNLTATHALIATDLVTLPAALVLKGILNIPVLYDAHEYWPEVDSLFTSQESRFWMQMENNLVQYSDYCQTVSRGLADLMTLQYQKKFEVVPNAVPLKDAQTRATVSLDRESKLRYPEQELIYPEKACRFLYQGSFAPQRGLDLLIAIWSEVDDRAILLLRGPDAAYKNYLIELAHKTQLLNKRIFFMKPVDESELVSALSDGDIGLIPYTGVGILYQNCCPNKLSQYMAGSMPVLANNTNFVRHIIQEASCGIVVDFNNKKALIEAIHHLISQPGLRAQYAQNGFEYLKNKFHWETVSLPLYHAIFNLTAHMQANSFEVNVVRHLNEQQNPVRFYFSKIVQCARPAVFLYYVWGFFPKKIRFQLSPYLKRIFKK